MSQFLLAYRELVDAPTSDVALLQLHQLMTGTGAVNGVDEAKATVKAMAEAIVAALAE